jgi:hypothetical protein
MTETKKQGRKAETIEDLDASIERMEAEFAEGYGRPLSWEEVTSTTADELAAKEQRRSMLPRLITAARVRRLELQRARWERNLAPLEHQREEAHKRLEAAEAKYHEALEERNLARREWDYANGLIQSRQEPAGPHPGGKPRDSGTPGRGPMRTDEEREQGRQFSEMLRQSYEASRFRAGIEWLEGSAGEEEPNDSDPDEAGE